VTSGERAEGCPGTRQGGMISNPRATLFGLFLLCASTGCADVLLSPEPGDSPPEVAHAFWTEVDQYYSYFDVNGIDWDSIGGEYLPRVTASTTDNELFNVLGVMLSKLRDGHATLDSPSRHYEYDGWYVDYPPNYEPAFIGSYLGSPRGSAAGSAVSWGRLGAGIGYLRIATFEQPGIGEGVDTALASLGASMRGLVLDIRSNGGGSDTEGEAAAGRVTTERVLYRIVRYKNGPAHDAFGPKEQGWLEPAGRQRYLGPVAVLTNRGVYSAAEDFLLAMRVLPRVTTVGDTTGGGSGNPIPRELPNGWVVHVPRWQVWGADGTFFEGVGLAPDVEVQMTDADRLKGRDSILERAIQVVLDESNPGG
jgi:hypothetical protein